MTDSRDESVRSGKFVAPPVPTDREAAWAIHLIAAFALPFCLAGVVLTVAAVRRGLAGDWPNTGLFTVLALVFGGAGFGILAAIVLGRRKVDAYRARAAAHPDEPWLWREDWAARRVLDHARSGMWTGIVFALVWNLIAVPVAIAVVREATARGNRMALVALVFPLAGVAILASAVRRTLQYRRFGVSSLELERVPIPVGRRFAGTVRARLATPPADGFRVVLSCINRVTTGAGDDRTTSERIQWQEERRVPGTAVRDYLGAGTTIPVEFALPPDARGTDESTPRDTIVWRLSVSAALPGVDYAASFDVPVYYTDESARPAPAETASGFASPTVPEPPSAPTIAVTRDGASVTIDAPAFRNPGPTVGLAAFSLLWTATIWLQRALGAPLFFPVVTGIFAFFLWWLVVAMALGTSRALVGPDGVTVTHRLLGVPRRRTIPAADVDRIETPIEMQVGTTPYYSVLVRRRAIPGRTLAGALTVASGIRDKREAERLVATIGEALGRTPVA